MTMELEQEGFVNGGKPDVPPLEFVSGSGLFLHATASETLMLHHLIKTRTLCTVEGTLLNINGSKKNLKVKNGVDEETNS